MTFVGYPKWPTARGFKNVKKMSNWTFWLPKIPLRHWFYMIEASEGRSCWIPPVYKPPFIFYAYDTKSVKSSNPRASSKQLSQIEHIAPASSSILKGFALKMTLKTCAPPLRPRGPTPLPPLPKLADFFYFFSSIFWCYFSVPRRSFWSIVSTSGAC